MTTLRFFYNLGVQYARSASLYNEISEAAPPPFAGAAHIPISHAPCVRTSVVPPNCNVELNHPGGERIATSFPTRMSSMRSRDGDNAMPIDPPVQPTTLFIPGASPVFIQPVTMQMTSMSGSEMQSEYRNPGGCRTRADDPDAGVSAVLHGGHARRRVAALAAYPDALLFPVTVLRHISYVACRTGMDCMGFAGFSAVVVVEWGFAVDDWHSEE